MKVYQGLGVSGLPVIGTLRIIRQKEYNITNKKVMPAQVEAELQTLNLQLEKVRGEILSHLSDRGMKQNDREILQFQSLILSDPIMLGEVTSLIRNQCFSATFAVYTYFQTYIASMQNLDKDFYAQKADDYKDVAHQLLISIGGEQIGEQLSWNSGEIACLPQITPSLVVRIAKASMSGYVTTHGSYNSHSSILTRSFQLPAVTSVGDILPELLNGQTAILDPDKGLLITDPDELTLSHYKKFIKEQENTRKSLQAILSQPAVTAHGIPVTLCANIEYPEEKDLVLNNHFDGIGLYRTEFLYLNTPVLPDEETQFAAYRDVLTALGDKPVVIRTFDLGGDKLSHLLHFKREENPYLGRRGIRFSLAQPELFKTQLRAILRAAVFGNARLMFPMVNSVEEVLAARHILTQGIGELQEEGIEHQADIPVGVMIETPAAVLNIDQLARVCSFFSIGTNDLVQYILATDRNNDAVSDYYIPHHPAVLKLIRQTVRAAADAHIPLAVCGEMASQPLYLPLLIGMGITELSVVPSAAAQVKAIIRKCDHRLQELVDKLNPDMPIAMLERFLHTELSTYTQTD